MGFWYFFLFFFSIAALFVSLWIILPPPNLLLLIFAIGALELSPWLVIVNTVFLLLAIIINRNWLSNWVLIFSSISLILSSLPLLQLVTTNHKFSLEMERGLGKDYLTKLPQKLPQQMRLIPWQISTVFRKISNAQVRITRGIIFANPDGVELKLNLYRPLTRGKKPTLIIIYGGAWRSGSPDNYEQFSSYIAKQGYSVITIDYRHTPKYKFPAQLEDVNAALKYIQNNADSLEVDLEKMSIMGRSAGGHLATLVAYQQNALPFRSVISYYSPVNLIEGYSKPPVPDPINSRRVLKNFLGGSPKQVPELYRQASPINYPRPNLPPTLLVYSRRDSVVRVEFGKQLYDKLQKTGNTAIWLEVPWAEHAFDTVFFGLSNQLVLYYTEVFLAFTLKN